MEPREVEHLPPREVLVERGRLSGSPTTVPPPDGTQTAPPPPPMGAPGPVTAGAGLLARIQRKDKRRPRLRAYTRRTDTFADRAGEGLL